VRQIQFRVGIVLCFLLTIGFTAACSYRTEGPYTLLETTNRLGELNRKVTVVDLASASKYADLNPTIYYYDMVDDFGLITYFVDGASNKSVAKIQASRMPPALDFALSNSQHVTLDWANKSQATTCEPRPGLFPRNDIQGDAPQTCLTWRFDSDTFLLFSSLPLTETLDFANSLKIVN